MLKKENSWWGDSPLCSKSNTNGYIYNFISRKKNMKGLKLLLIEHQEQEIASTILNKLAYKIGDWVRTYVEPIRQEQVEMTRKVDLTHYEYSSRYKACAEQKYFRLPASIKQYFSMKEESDYYCVVASQKNVEITFMRKINIYAREDLEELLARTMVRDKDFIANKIQDIKRTVESLERDKKSWCDIV